MLSSLDGRIDSAAWGGQAGIDRDAYVAAYEAVDRTLQGDAWIVGRTTMEEFADGQAAYGDPKIALPRQTFWGASAGPYAVALDPSGKLNWTRNTAYGDHVIEVLSESVADAYLQRLQSAGVSYLFAGTNSIDLKLALSKLRTEFGIERLLLEGGGRINGSFLAEGLVDELSLLLAPVLDGRRDSPASFDRQEMAVPERFAVTSIKRRDDDLLWLRYARAD
jgi:riboflavin biosynthesis pyrimidine reductase